MAPLSVSKQIRHIIHTRCHIILFGWPINVTKTHYITSCVNVISCLFKKKPVNSLPRFASLHNLNRQLIKTSSLNELLITPAS